MQYVYQLKHELYCYYSAEGPVQEIEVRRGSAPMGNFSAVRGPEHPAEATGYTRVFAEFIRNNSCAMLRFHTFPKSVSHGGKRESNPGIDDESPRSVFMLH